MTELYKIRLAALSDLDGLVQLEERAFATDRFHREQIEYLVEEAHSSMYVVESEQKTLGAAYMLWRRRSPVGRLYNIAVDPDARGRGIGQRLLDVCVQEAGWRDCSTLSLEVRADNFGAIALYQRNKFELTEKLPGYYDDGSTGLRMTRPIAEARPKEFRLDVPYYAQSLDFTCGPAALLMAMHYFRPDFRPDRLTELNIWKEATLIYTTSGMGGTGPFGLALSARRRGFSTRVLLSKNQTPFFSSVRTKDKRRIIKLVHEDLRRQAYADGIPISYYDFPFDDIAVEMLRGRVPIVLISTFHLHGDRAPHWVVMTGFDQEHVYFHDPYETEYGSRPHRARNVKIPLTMFSRMRKYGRDLYKSVIFVGPEEFSL